MVKGVFLSFISFLCLSLSSCSNLEFATNWADTYIDHQINNYFDLDRAQDIFTSGALKDNVRKIRKEIYPVFAAELLRAAAELEKTKTVQVAQLEESHRHLQEAIMKALTLIEPSAQDFVGRLRPEQLKSFEKEFARKNEKIQKEVDDHDTAVEEQSDRMESQLKYWLGGLSSEDRKQIRKFCEENPYPQKERLENRRKIAAQFVSVFPDAEKRRAFIHTLFTDYKSLHEKAYTKAMTEYQKDLRAFLTGFINGLKADEKKTLTSNFRKRADELRRISEKK